MDPDRLTLVSGRLRPGKGFANLEGFSHRGMHQGKYRAQTRQ
jgi:hypothetical protein